MTMLQSFQDPLVALHDVTLKLLSDQDSENLLETILDQALEFTHADSGSISLLDEQRKFLKIRAQRGLDNSVTERLMLKLGEGVTGRCILTGRTRNIGDTTKDPYYVEVRPDIRSELAVPLRVGKKSFGVISVDSSRFNAFDNAHEEYLELLSSYASQILTNQQTLLNLTNRTHIMELLLEIASIIGKFPTFAEFSEETMRLLEEKGGVQKAAIHLHDEVSNELEIVSYINYTTGEKEKSRYAPGEGITGQVFKEKKPFAIPDVTADQNFLNKSGSTRVGTSSWSFFASPVFTDKRIRGVFSMEILYQSKSLFEDYTFLVQILSSFFGQAIHIQEIIEARNREILTENIDLKRRLGKTFSFSNIVGSSRAMTELYEKISMAADSTSSVLITGESGTGKELIANALHENSVRRDKNIVKINCAAIPGDLLESELFGHVKGAYTGAHDDRKGKIMLAHKGTLFLDEIGEMDYKLQAKLLRVLQEKEFSPLGSDKVLNVDVRIISATNADLHTLIQEKKFREDLFYRLNVINLQIPPLRERKEDLPALVSFFIQKINRENHRNVDGIQPDAFRMLEKYSFPGNIRELENMIERAIVLTSNKTLTVSDFQLLKPAFAEIPAVEKRDEPPQYPNVNEAITIPKDNAIFNLESFIRGILRSAPSGEYREAVISRVERELLLIVLQKNLFNKSKTAKQLGINRLTLDRKIEEYGIIEAKEAF